MKNLMAIILLFVTVLLLLPLPVSAQSGFSLVPCGQTQPPNNEPCQFRHLVILVVRLINYLITVAAIVAMYQVLLAGFNMVSALGNVEKIAHAKEGVSNAIVGFGIVLLAFVMVNLLVNGIFGRADAVRKWWEPQCIYQYNITECPV